MSLIERLFGLSRNLDVRNAALFSRPAISVSAEEKARFSHRE